MPGTRRSWLQDLIGHSAVGLDIRALDLHVDGRGQAEVENLGDDVGGQEIENHPGKLLGELFAQGPDIVRRRAMLWVERHGDVGIARPDHAIGAVHGVHGAIGQADVVDDGTHFMARNHLPDGVLHQVAEPRRLLNAGAGFRSHMQDELTTVGTGEEILPQEGRQEEGAQACAEKHRDKQRSPVQPGR